MAASQLLFAIVAELADAHGSGPCTRKGVGVRVPSMAPRFLLMPKSFTALPISPAGSRLRGRSAGGKEAQVDVERMRFESESRGDARELAPQEKRLRSGCRR